MRSAPIAAAAARANVASARHTFYASHSLCVAREHCQRPSGPRSQEEQQPHHVMVFPTSGVNRLHVDGDSYVVDPSHVALFNHGQAYRVSHPMGSGETTVHVALPDGALLDLLESQHPDLPASRDRPFRRNHVRRPARLHLELVRLIATCGVQAPDPLEVEESALALLDSVARELATLERMQSGSRLPADRELADAAATLLAARYTEPLSLDEIGQALGVTKFRLCRVFRRVTGETVGSRIQQLRARHAAVALGAGVDSLADLAFELGFSSHSHLSACFRRVFGTTPSAVNRRRG